MKRFIIKDFEQVFTPEFTEYLCATDEAPNKIIMQKILEKIEQFEDRYDCTFSMVYGNEFVIFRKNENT